MMKFMAAVLSVIAVGVLGIAYGLLSPRLSMNDLQASQTYPIQGVPVAAAAPGVLPASVLTMPVAPAQPMRVQTPPMQTVARPVYQPDVVYVPASTTSAPDAGVINEPVARPVRTVYTPASSRDDERASVERSPRRDWKRTAMIVGGTSAAGAGVGAIFGGKKGALIGAAIGGGASTIYQTTR